MRLGCLFALVTFIVLIFVGGVLSAAVEALFLGMLNVNPEGVGGIIGLLYFFFIGPYVFILGYREQRKNEKEKRGLAKGKPAPSQARRS